MAFIAGECFFKWHQDATVSNNNQTAKNHSVWTNHRTCYGTITISSMSNKIITWNIAVQHMSGSGYVGIGIDNDECRHINTWFYENKETANYSYECTGKMYAFNKSEAVKGCETYNAGDFITMTLNTLNSTLTFAKNHAFQHSFSIEQNDKLNYRLAVSIKDATVSIINCCINKIQLQKEMHIAENKEDNIESKEENIHYDNMTKIVSKLNSEIKYFKEMYNEKSINETFNRNLSESLDKNSGINNNIKVFENFSLELTKSLNDLNKYVENTKLLIDNMLDVDKLEYKDWNINKMMIWICQLENGRYCKYLQQLMNGFMKSEIFKGEYLPDLDVPTLSVVPFEIKSFPDKRDLIKQFKSLQSVEIAEGAKTVYIHH